MRVNRIAIALCATCVFGCAQERDELLTNASDFDSSTSMRVGETVVITANPKFVRNGRFVDLVMSDGDRTVSVGWSMPPDMQFIPVSLNENQAYAFTIKQKPFYDFSVPELQKVQLDGQTIYDIEVCEVHQIKMDYKKVRILYGYYVSGPNEPTHEEEQQIFPHRHEVSLGGCVTTPDSPKSESIYVCSECKEAYASWKLERVGSK